MTSIGNRMCATSPANLPIIFLGFLGCLLPLLFTSRLWTEQSQVATDSEEDSDVTVLQPLPPGVQYVRAPAAPPSKTVKEKFSFMVTYIHSYLRRATVEKLQLSPELAADLAERLQSPTIEPINGKKVKVSDLAIFQEWLRDFLIACGQGDFRKIALWNFAMISALRGVCLRDRIADHIPEPTARHVRPMLAILYFLLRHFPEKDLREHEVPLTETFPFSTLIAPGQSVADAVPFFTQVRKYHGIDNRALVKDGINVTFEVIRERGGVTQGVHTPLWGPVLSKVQKMGPEGLITWMQFQALMVFFFDSEDLALG